MNLALITNSEERCGIAEYGRNLCGELQKYFVVIPQATCPADASTYHTVLINWSPYTVHFHVNDLQRMKQQGARVVLLMHESTAAQYVVNTDALAVADVVVAHEPMDIRGARVDFRMIPHGIVEVADLPVHILSSGSEPRIGTAGFCFPNKNMEATIKAANHLSGTPVLIAPRHSWHDPTGLWQKFQAMSPRLELVTDYLSEEDTIRRLNTCDINVYVAREDGPGQSGSVRMIIGARRPTIAIRYRKTSMLFPYEDELYFVDSPEQVPQMAEQIWSAIRSGAPVKFPDRVIRDTGWTRTGEMFRDLILEPVCV